MEAHFKALLEAIGEDPSREGLLNTPQRSAKAFSYLTKGYNENLNEIVNDAIFESKLSELVIVKNIELYSLCEHHLLPFIGRCHVGYLPDGKIIGLSKVARIVDMYARRLQVQENLTQEIAEALLSVTGAKGVGVVIEAKHLCMMMRGVEKQNGEMSTSIMLGKLRDDSRTRSEFLSLIKR